MLWRAVQYFTGAALPDETAENVGGEGTPGKFGGLTTLHRPVDKESHGSSDCGTRKAAAVKAAARARAAVAARAKAAAAVPP